jgi:Kef-type K+ transport system membrane component KefB
VYPIGMMMLGLATLSVPFYLAKQSQIIACIIVGAVVGYMGGCVCEYHTSKVTHH